MFQFFLLEPSSMPPSMKINFPNISKVNQSIEITDNSIIQNKDFITTSKVKNIIKYLLNRKVISADQIRNLVLKKSPKIVILLLTCIFKSNFRLGCFHLYWEKTVTILNLNTKIKNRSRIPKKSSPNQLTSFKI